MGFRIKEFREAKKMTQEELAQKSGVSRNLIARLESGNITNTTTDTLFKIAEALETSVDNLFFCSLSSKF